MSDVQVTVEDTPDFIQLFIQYVQEHERRPQSVQKFAAAMGFKAAVFYQHYNALPALEKVVWVDLLNRTFDRLKNAPEYSDFSVREKLLAFHFTWVETVKSHAGFVRISIKSYAGPFGDLPPSPPSFILAMKQPFKSWSRRLVDEGVAAGEILERPPLGKTYPDALWAQFLSLILVWLKDNSTNWETTDDAIEKSVNLGFDLMGRNPVDEAVDLAKTLFQVLRS